MSHTPLSENAAVIDSSASTVNDDVAVDSPIPIHHINGTFDPSVQDYSQYTLKRRPWRTQVQPFQTIIDKQYRGSGTPEDPYLVVWLDKDAENPKAYASIKRWTITMLAASATLSTALASSAYSGAVGPMVEDFQCSLEIIILGLSIMVVGFAFGPLLWAPLSEAYGRRYPLCISFIFYTMWTAVMPASQNVESLVVFRFLAGLFGSSALVIPGGQIADMFSNEARGLAIGVFCAAPFLGPATGPIIGGFLGDAGGWRWVMGLLAIYSAILTCLILLFLPETYAPALLRKRAKILSEVTKHHYISITDASKPLDFGLLMKESLIRPWVMLFREPIILIISIYMSCVYGTLYLLFAAFPIIFQQGRGWNAGQGGLAFLGVCIGLFIGVVYICWDNRRYVKALRATHGLPPPEIRLPPACYGGGFLIVGLAWFAATDGPNVHWIVPIIACIPFAIGFVLVFVCLGNYLVDAYVVFAASVFAANSVMRSLVGAAFPLFTTYMFQNIGIHWGAAVPGFIALACFPFPILFLKYGKQIRLKCKYAAEAERILEGMKTDEERSLAKKTNEDVEKHSSD